MTADPELPTPLLHPPDSALNLWPDALIDEPPGQSADRQADPAGPVFTTFDDPIVQIQDQPSARDRPKDAFEGDERVAPAAETSEHDRGGPYEGFEEMAAGCVEELRRYVAAQLGRRAVPATILEADDVVQVTLQKAFQRWSGRAIVNPAAWLTTIAKNAIVDALRAAPPMSSLPLPWDDATAPAVVPGPAGTPAQDDVPARLDFAAAASYLPDRRRKAIILRSLGFRRKDIATILEVSPKDINGDLRGGYLSLARLREKGVWAQTTLALDPVLRWLRHPRGASDGHAVRETVHPGHQVSPGCAPDHAVPGQTVSHPGISSHATAVDAGASPSTPSSGTGRAAGTSDSMGSASPPMSPDLQDPSANTDAARQLRPAGPVTEPPVIDRRLPRAGRTVAVLLAVGAALLIMVLALVVPRPAAGIVRQADGPVSAAPAPASLPVSGAPTPGQSTGPLVGPGDGNRDTGGSGKGGRGTSASSGQNNADRGRGGSPARLSASVAVIDFGTIATGVDIVIRNSGGTATTWTARSAATWLNITPAASAPLAPGGSVGLAIKLDRDAAPGGKDTTSVVVDAPGLEPLTIPVAAAVAHPPRISNFVPPSGCWDTASVAVSSRDPLDSVVFEWVDTTSNSDNGVWMTSQDGTIYHGTLSGAGFHQGDALVVKVIATTRTGAETDTGNYAISTTCTSPVH